MEPILSPWIIYWLGVVGYLPILFIILIAISICVGLMSGISIIVDNAKEYKPMFIMSIIGVVISTLMLIFIPSKNTLIQMIVLEQITPDNLELLKEMGLSLTDFTLETMGEAVEILTNGITDVIQGVK